MSGERTAHGDLPYCQGVCGYPQPNSLGLDRFQSLACSEVCAAPLGPRAMSQASASAAVARADLAPICLLPAPARERPGRLAEAPSSRLMQSLDPSCGEPLPVLRTAIEALARPVALLRDLPAVGGPVVGIPQTPLVTLGASLVAAVAGVAAGGGRGNIPCHGGHAGCKHRSDDQDDATSVAHFIFS